MALGNRLNQYWFPFDKTSYNDIHLEFFQNWYDFTQDNT